MAWLDGKRALVVGAGSGIGRAVLTAFRAEGARVAALEVDQAKAGRLAAELPGCVVSRGDATRMADARAAVRGATNSFGGLDVLVNCVGIFDFYRGLADIDDDQLDAAFDEVFAVNVKSQLVCERDLQGRTPAQVLLAAVRRAQDMIREPEAARPGQLGAQRSPGRYAVDPHLRGQFVRERHHAAADGEL